jgi:hypothetical protein
MLMSVSSYTELLENEHKRVEKIIASFETAEMPKVWMHLVQASNSLRAATSAAGEYEKAEKKHGKSKSAVPKD